MTLGHATLFEPLTSVHMYKDVGQFAAAFSKVDPDAGPSAILHCGREDVEVPSALQPLLTTQRISATTRWSFYWRAWRRLLRGKAKSVTLYHATREHLLFAALLRVSGLRVYLKLDMDAPTADRLVNTWRARWRPTNWLVTTLLGLPNLVSCEDEDVFQKLKCHRWASRRLTLVPNAMLKEAAPCEQTTVSRRRENAILVVGRIGAEQKNCEAILAALERLSAEDISSWRIHFCGPMTTEFESRLARLVAVRNDMAHTIVIRGELSRESLFQAYLNSKVFLMTSRYEGFSLAALEAAWAGCYLAATPVGGMKQLTDDWRLGHRLAFEDVSGLASFLRQLGQDQITSLDDELPRLNHVRGNFTLESHATRVLAKLGSLESVK